MTSSKRIARFVSLGLLTSLTLCVSALVAELALRASRADSLYTEIKRHPPHPFLQAVTSMAADHVNAQGFRGESVAPVKPAGAFRIFAVGGSTTLGVTNRYEESYPFLLQQLLRERYPGTHIEVLNAGCPWYTSAHALVAYMIRVRQYDPDLVIYFEGINDLVRSFSPPWLAQGGYKPDYSHYLGPYARLLGPQVDMVDPPSSWLIWNAVVHWWRGRPNPFDIRDRDNVARVAARFTPDDKPSFRSLPSFVQYSDAIIQAVRADGRTVITASQASLYRTDLTEGEQRLLWFSPLLAAESGKYPSLAAMTRGMATYNDAARQLAARRGVAFVDFAASVPKTTTYFTDDVHLTKAGNEILASAAAEMIQSARLIERAIEAAPTARPPR
jgi:lysophospholipase L1-like esterase